MFTIVSFVYYLSVKRALWLVNFAGRLLLHGPLNLKGPIPARPIKLRDIILLTSFLSVSTVSHGSLFFPVDLWRAAQRESEREKTLSVTYSTDLELG